MLMAAAGMFLVEEKNATNRCLMALFSDRIMMQGVKSMVLVQALQVTSLCYYSLKRLVQLKFYRLVQ